MKHFFSLCIFILSTLLLGACSADKEINLDEEFSMKLEVSELTGKNQAEEAFATSEKKGEFWLANFIFTNCDTVCPPMTANMARVQRQMKEEGLDISIVSFSIDPDVDTPAALKAYGDQVEADYSSWDFVTGYSQEDIERFANVSFMVPAAKDESSDQYMHSTGIFLVDKEGYVREQYSGMDVPFEEIMEDLKKVRE